MTRKVSDRSSMRTLARRMNLRSRCSTAPASSRGSTANTSSGGCAQQREHRDRAALRAVQAGECAMRRRRASRHRPKAGPAGSARHRRHETPARPIHRAGSTDRRQWGCSSLFLKGFHMVGAADSGRIRARAECPFRRRSPERRRRRAGSRASSGVSADTRCLPKLAVRRGRNLRASAIGKRMAAVSISKVNDGPATALPSSRRVQVHVHHVAVDPAPDNRLRGGGRFPAVRLVAHGAGIGPGFLRARHAVL